ncbi:MAG: universal stress protein [Pelotomaculum sp.]|uniref:Universal stress protein UspA and related nucleotide-binding proteins n=1 Tax=Pelotomaculum thermopropionicum (strain DSM 13744 / JCM 10971 / SI) TaxID=370438 RepID=A5D2N3_PELTS|nr:universal stress protein [Pelotomaculum sp.]BAF59517.1 universal stress protein UspA and related nucleotide-binding proteins [Pelotomaculum thermopropionicum SI]
MLKSRVLLPSDGSDSSMKAAIYAARLMKTNPEMQLSVLVVVQDSSALPGVKDEEREMLKEIDEAMEIRGTEILQKTVGYFSGEGLKVDGFIKKGDPAAVIVDFARQGDYDHIIMGSRGASELRSLSVGSVSHKVINLAECRVTLVK